MYVRLLVLGICRDKEIRMEFSLTVVGLCRRGLGGCFCSFKGVVYGGVWVFDCIVFFRRL